MLGLSSGQIMDDNKATGFSGTSIPFHQNLRINISEYRAVQFFEKEEDEVVRIVIQQMNELQHHRYCMHNDINMTMTAFGRNLIKIYLNNNLTIHTLQNSEHTVVSY